MTCSLKGGPKLVFLKSDMEVRCRDLSTRSSHSRYAYAKIKVSLDDGERIAAKAKSWEPVEIRFDGIVQDRYIYPPSTLEIGHKEAWLKVYDARKVLDRGVLTNHFDEVQVGDVMDYIISNKDDPYNAITGWKAVDGYSVQQEVQNLEEDWNELLYGEESDQNGGVGEVLSDALADLSRFAELYLGGPGTVLSTYNGLTLEDDSPNTALAKIEETFGAETWVGPDGVLWIGNPEMAPRNVHVITGEPSDRSYSMKEYSVTRGASSVAGVRLNGKPATANQSRGFLYSVAQNAETELFPIAEAVIVDESGEMIDGPVIAPEEPVNIYSLGDLEQAARSTLQQYFYNYRNGNVVFNGAQSENQEALAKIAVGDRIVVGNSISDYCQTTADGGHYGIKEVQHKVDPRQGWKITAEVVQLAPPIETTSLYYNPENDDAYANLNSYKNE